MSCKMAVALLRPQISALRLPRLPLTNQPSHVVLQHFCAFSAHTSTYRQHPLKHQNSRVNSRCHFAGNDHYRLNLVSRKLEGWHLHPIRFKETLANQMHSDITLRRSREEVLEVLQKLRTVTDASDVCSVFANLHTIIDWDWLESVQFVTDYEDFEKHAANQVNRMTNDELCNTMLAISELLHTSLTFSSRLLCELYSEGHRRLHTFDIHQLSKFAKFIHMIFKSSRGRCYGAISSRFSELFETLSDKSVQELIAFMQTTIYTTTRDFQHQVLRKAKSILTAVIDDKDVIVAGSDIVKILRYQTRTGIKPTEYALNQLCCQFLYKQIKTTSTKHLYAAYQSLMELRHTDVTLNEAILAESVQRLPETQEAKNLGLLLKLISISNSSFRVGVDSLPMAMIEDKIKDLLLNHADAPLSKICFASRRLEYEFTPILLDALSSHMTCRELNVSNMLHIAQYLALFRRSKPVLKAWECLQDKLHAQRNTEYSPKNMVDILTSQSRIPVEMLTEAELAVSPYKDILPQLNGIYVNHLFRGLVNMKSKLERSSRKRDAFHIEQLLEKVNHRAIETIHDITNPGFLQDIFYYNLTDGTADSTLLKKISKQYCYALCVSNNHRDAVRCAEFLLSQGYRDVALLDTITDLLSERIQDMRLNDIIMVTDLCTLHGHDTPNIHVAHFLQVSIERVTSLIVDDLPYKHIYRLLHYALNLTYMQQYPEALLKKIFSVEFLEKFDALQGKRYISHDRASDKRSRTNLKNLNRSVVLECPELQIPWFHETYCQQQLQQAKPHASWLITPALQDALVEVLGGDQYFRSLVLAPYYINILFEFVLDAEGCPLPITEYDSVLSPNRPDQPGKCRIAQNEIQWSLYSKELPKGAQRVAIDYLERDHQYHGQYKTKRRNLEIMGYKYIQIPYYEWELQPEKIDRVVYLQNLLFG